MTAKIINFPVKARSAEPHDLWGAVMGNPFMAAALMPMLINEQVARFEAGMPAQTAHEALRDVITGASS